MHDDDDVLFWLATLGGIQPVGGQVRDVTPRQHLVMTMPMFRRIITLLKPNEAIALSHFIEHAYKPGQPVVLDGWSARWLEEQGMGKQAAISAARGLRDKGYIETFKINGDTPGQQRAVIVGELIGEPHPNYDANPKNDRSNNNDSPSVTKPEMGVKPQVNPIMDKSIDGDDGPICASVHNGQKGEVKPQVNPIMDKSIDGDSRGLEVEKKIFFSTSNNIDFDWGRHFLLQPAIVNALTRNRENAARAFTTIFDTGVGTAALTQFIRSADTSSPAETLSHHVLDVLTDPAGIATAEVKAILKINGVHHSKVGDPDIIRAAYVMAISTSYGQTVRSLPGWFGTIMNRHRFMVTGPARQFLATCDTLLGLPSTSSTPTGQTAKVNIPRIDDDRVTHLAKVAIPTPWCVDDIMFEKFLRNPTAQTKAEEVWEQFAVSSQKRFLAIDAERYKTEPQMVTYAGFLNGLRWDWETNTIVDPDG